MTNNVTVLGAIISIASFLFAASMTIMSFALLDIRNRLVRIEKMVGNGDHGVFVRRGECALLMQVASSKQAKSHPEHG